MRLEKFIYEFFYCEILIVVIEILICVVIIGVLVVGNVFVMVVLYRNLRLWRFLNFYIGLFVIFDILLLFVVMFFMCILVIVGCWIFGEVICWL